MAERRQQGTSWPEGGSVHHLVFEGGQRGRSYAYLGALAALADMGYLKEVNRKRGVDYVIDNTLTASIAGSSEGAFLALLLSSGVGVREIYRMAVEGVFETELLDDERRGVRRTPMIGGHGCEEEPISDPNEELFGVASVDGLGAGLWNRFKARYGERLVNEAALKLGAAPVVSTYLSKAVVKRVLRTGQATTYLRNLRREFGLFSGCRTWLFGHAVSSTFQWTEEPVGDVLDETKALGPLLDPITFEEHQDHFGVELVVVGSDLRTGEWRYFSATPRPDRTFSELQGAENISIADAVRLSMAVPFLYKPTVIEEGDLKGVWVEGAVLNGYPIRAFDPSRGSVNENVLGFRLESERASVDNLLNFVLAAERARIRTAADHQIVFKRAQQRTLTLPTGSLERTVFTPDERDLRDAMVASASRVYRYFRGHRFPADSRAATVVDHLVQGTDPIPKRVEPVERGDRVLREATRRKALEIIKATPGHPLCFLVNPETGRFWPARARDTITTDGEGKTVPWWLAEEDRKPPVDAGHLTSRVLLESELEATRLALEDAYQNRQEGRTLENPRAVGGAKEGVAIDVNGVPVEVRTGKLWEGDVVSSDVELNKSCPLPGLPEGYTNEKIAGDEIHPGWSAEDLGLDVKGLAPGP